MFLYLYMCIYTHIIFTICYWSLYTPIPSVLTDPDVSIYYVQSVVQHHYIHANAWKLGYQPVGISPKTPVNYTALRPQWLLFCMGCVF